MNEVSKWFDRKFDLSFPTDLFPTLCIRLRGTPARLEELLNSYSQQTLTRRHAETWSMQENAGHLLDLEPLWLGRVEDYVNGVETLRVADLTNTKTHQANHNAKPSQQILTEFRKARALLLDRVETIDPALYSRTATHPRLKTPLRLVDHLYFVAEHDDQHLARIWELGKK